MRRQFPQHLALHQRLAHQPEFVVLEITQPAVDQLGRPRRRTTRQIAHLAQQHAQPTSGRVTRNAAAVDATPDDKQIVDFRQSGNSDSKSARIKRLAFYR